MTRVVTLRAESAEPAVIVDRLAAVRQDGDVPLVCDDRWPSGMRAGIDRLVADAVLPADVAWATTTSGSTGAPRIVVRSAASWERSFAAVERLLGAEAGDRMLLPGPASSSLTLFSLAHALAGGPPPVPYARRAEATLFHGTPSHLRAVLADRPGSLRAALVGGAHLDESLRAEAEAGGIRVVSYYGAAELSFVAVDDDGGGLRAFPEVDLDVRAGEVRVRSPFVAHGYLGAPGPLRREGEWASVGDRATMRAGVLRLAGRADDAIVSGGATVVPAEVERVLRGLPGVADAVVVGVPASGVGELVAALVEPRAGAEPDASALRAAAAAALAPAHVPRLWFVGAVPRTTTGKPARAEVRRMLRSGGMPRA